MGAMTTVIMWEVREWQLRDANAIETCLNKKYYFTMHKITCLLASSL